MRDRGPAGAALLAALTVGLLGGCGGGHAAATVISCGSTRTAARVPVRVEIASGSVSCGTAMGIERAYAGAVASGRAPGNGGGGPVPVRGWTCQGFATPVVLRTGRASKCVRGGSEILAVLRLPK